jgi:hypothetical protein
MRMAKASPDDLDALRKFLNMVELTMERQKFSFESPVDTWLTLDDDDEDRIRMMRIRKDLAEDMGRDEDDVDNRIVIYEYLQELFRPASGWNRVVMGMDILVETVCDPQKNYLDFAPGYEYFHVAPEM